MSRKPTETEAAFDAWLKENRRQGRIERMASLCFEGWSPNTIKAATNPESRSILVDLPYAHHEQQSRRFHGVPEDATSRPSGRIRKDRPTKTGPLFVRLYGDV